MRYWPKEEKTEVQADKQPDRKFFILLAILAITFVSFSPVLNNNTFNWDDDHFLLENISVRSFNIKNMFTSTVLTEYIPLTVLSFALEYHSFGYNPFIYYLDNLLFHLAVTGLVFLFAQRLGLSVYVATFAALLFGIHPMHVESVAWVTQRKDVLYAVFYMGALCCYLQYLEDKRIKSYLLTIVLGILSVLAKPMALSLPLIMFVCDWLKERKFGFKVFLEKIPHFLYIIPIVYLTYRLHARIPGENFVEGSLIWMWSLTFYIQKFFSPAILIPLYSLPKPASFLNPHYVWALCILFMILICFVRYRRNRWLIFAGLFYFASIFFLLRYDDFERVIVADRYMYLPSVGVCIFLGILWNKILESTNKRRVIFKTFAHFCLIVLFSILGLKTYFQSKVWQDNVTLWTYVIQHSRKDAKVDGVAYENRGIAYNEQGKYDLAIADLNNALSLNSDYALVYNGRGSAYYNQGKYDLAMADYNKALEIFSEDNINKAHIYCNRGLIYFNERQYDLALSDYKRALFINPNFAKGYNDRSMIYKRQGDYDLALVDLNKALEIDSYLAEAYNRRGIVYGIKGEYDLAFDDFNKALAVKSNYLEAYNNRGLLYRKMGSYDLALADFNRVLEIDPNCVQAKNNREHIYEILGKGRKDKGK